MRLYRRRFHGARAPTWQLDVTLDGRRFRRSLRTADRGPAVTAAVGLLGRLEARGPSAGFEGSGALDGAFGAYRAELERRGRCATHVERTCRDLVRIRAAAGASDLEDLTTDAIAAALATIQGPVAQNRARAAAHAFFRWLCRQGKAGRNPVAPIERAREVPTRVRRALQEEELARLVALTPVLRRALFWLACARLGTRPRETARIRWNDIDLEARTVTLQAGWTKNRRRQLQPIPPDLFARLAGLDRGPDGEPVFGPEPDSTTFRRDLARAGIREETPQGVMDRGALRVTCGTSLKKAGIPLVDAQRYLRHSTPVLTANIYTRTSPEDLREAAERIGRDGRAMVPEHEGPSSPGGRAQS